MDHTLRARAVPAGAPTFSAEAYERHVGRYAPELATAMIELVGVEPGHRALDVGCGPGALTRGLVDLLGPGSVAAVDPSEPFVEVCRARTAGADVRVARAEELPFADGEFDVVLAQLVVQRMSDAPRGVGEMRRVANPGGTVAACTWDFASGMTMMRTFWDAAVALDAEGAARFGAGAPMPYCEPHELGELWRAAGLVQVELGQLLAGTDYHDFDDFWSSFLGGVGGSGAYVASLGDAQRKALRDEVRRRLDSPKGSFRLTARAWYVRGLAPD